MQRVAPQPSVPAIERAPWTHRPARLGHWRCILVLLVCSLFIGRAHALEREQRVMVAEVDGSLPVEHLRLLTASIRTTASRTLQYGPYEVMSPEGEELMTSVLGLDPGACEEGDCLVVQAAKAGADHMLSAEVFEVSGQLILTIKLLETSRGSQLAAEEVSAGDVLELRVRSEAAVKRLIEQSIPTYGHLMVSGADEVGRKMKLDGVTLEERVPWSGDVEVGHHVVKVKGDAYEVHIKSGESFELKLGEQPKAPAPPEVQPADKPFEPQAAVEPEDRPELPVQLMEDATAQPPVPPVPPVTFTPPAPRAPPPAPPSIPDWRTQPRRLGTVVAVASLATGTGLLVLGNSIEDELRSNLYEQGADYDAMWSDKTKANVSYFFGYACLVTSGFGVRAVVRAW